MSTEQLLKAFGYVFIGSLIFGLIYFLLLINTESYERDPEWKLEIERLKERDS